MPADTSLKPAHNWKRSFHRALNLLFPVGMGLVACNVSGLFLAPGTQAAPSNSIATTPAAQAALDHVKSTQRQADRSLDALPLLTRPALSYLGTFRVPHQDVLGNPLGYGGYALGYDAARQGLFFGGHDWYQELCEIGIPATIALTQTASILQNCTDVTEGRLSQIDQDSIKLGGTLVFNGRLIVSAYSYYDADGSQVLSHFVSGPDLSFQGDVSGPYPVGGDRAGIVSGYMTGIPAEWRAAFGGPALTGNCCLSIISRSSYGPAVSVFNPDDIGQLDPVPATSLLNYPQEHPLAAWDADSPYFNGSTHIVGVAFPPGSRSVLFFGRQGVGPFCYGTGAECNDPVDSSKGTHAYPYIHQVWAYDALDLLAVKDGTRQPWEAKPYALWQLSEMDASGGATIAGMTYDPASGRVYITEMYGESPAVHVYQIQTAGNPATTPAAYLPLVAANTPR
jgi:hypothetical protein